MGLTSTEAAALLLSNGQTTDPATAELIANNPEFDLDAMQRAHLRRMMGFDFTITIHAKRMVLQADGLKTTCYYSGVMDDKAIKRLVRACLRLKQKHASR